VLYGIKKVSGCWLEPFHVKHQGPRVVDHDLASAGQAQPCSYRCSTSPAASLEKLAPERLLHPVHRCAPWESPTQAQHLDAREATYAPMPNLPAGLAIPASHLHALLLGDQSVLRMQSSGAVDRTRRNPGVDMTRTSLADGVATSSTPVAMRA